MRSVFGPEKSQSIATGVQRPSTGVLVGGRGEKMRAVGVHRDNLKPPSLVARLEDCAPNKHKSRSRVAAVPDRVDVILTLQPPPPVRPLQPRLIPAKRYRVGPSFEWNLSWSRCWRCSDLGITARCESGAARDEHVGSPNTRCVSPRCEAKARLHNDQYLIHAV